MEVGCRGPCRSLGALTQRGESVFKILFHFMNITALWFLVEQIQERPTFQGYFWR